MTTENMTAIKLSVAAFVAALTALWGWFGWLVLAWVFLMLMDWLIGSAVAAKNGEWSSEELRNGAWHKAGQMIVVGVAVIVDWLIATVIVNVPSIILPFDYSVLISALVLVWYVVGELGSLAEHAVSVGAPVPSWLIAMLEISQTALETAGNGIVEVDDES